MTFADAASMPRGDENEVLAKAMRWIKAARKDRVRSAQADDA
jgi:hypothetical protein